MTRKIRILGWEYEIDRTKTSKQLSGNAGGLSVKTGRLMIAADVNDQAARSILVHEIIEAINYHMALNLDHDTIDRLECGIVSVISDNGGRVTK